MQQLWRYYKIDAAAFAQLTNHQIEAILLRPEKKK